MLRKIQAGLFVLCTHSKPDGLIYDEQDDECSNNRKSPCDGGADCLIEHLVAIAFEKAGGFARAECGVDDAIGEDAGEDRTEGAAGSMYAEGNGVPQSNVEAYFWWSLAAASNTPAADPGAANRDEVAAKLSAKELSDAKQQVAQWVAAHTPANPQ